MSTIDQQLRQPGESSVAFIERRMAQRLEDARRRYLTSASQKTMQALTPTTRAAGSSSSPEVGAADKHTNAIHPTTEAANVRSSSILSSLSSSSSAYLQRPAEQSLRDLHRSSSLEAPVQNAFVTQVNPRSTTVINRMPSPRGNRSPRLSKPGLVHSSLWFHASDPHSLVLPPPQQPEIVSHHAGPVRNNHLPVSSAPSPSSHISHSGRRNANYRSVDEVSILTTHRELQFPDPSPVRAAPILSSSSSSIDERITSGGEGVVVAAHQLRASASPRRHQPDLVEMIIGSHTKAQRRDAPHYQHDRPSPSNAHMLDEDSFDEEGGVNRDDDASGTALEARPHNHHDYLPPAHHPLQIRAHHSHHYHSHYHQHSGDLRLHHDEHSIKSFWITVWPGFYRSGQPKRICVNPRTTYFQTVLERAASATRCTPAPTILFTPDGKSVYDLDGLVANGHYLIAPSAVKYHVDMVPNALLRELVRAAEAVVEGRP